MFVKTRSSHAGRKVASLQPALFLCIAVLSALTMYPSKAQAQVVGYLEVNIPFQFHVGDAKLPAGEYWVHVLDNSDLTVMEISSVDGSASALFQVESTDANIAPANNELVFNKYGNRYFLAKLFDEANPSGSQVVESRYEKMTGKEAPEAQEHVPANRRTRQGS